MVGKLTPDTIISASRIPVLLGASPYASPNDLLREMVDIVHHDVRRAPWNGNEATRWGDRLEPVILGEAAQRLALTNVVLDHDRAIFHPTLEMACSLDGSGEGAGQVKTSVENLVYAMNAPEIDITGFGVLEAKVTSAMPEDMPPPQRGPLQLQAQMMCTGYTWGVVATLYRGIELRLFVYQEDDVIQKRIAEAVDDFERRKIDIDWYPPLTSEDANTAWSNVDDAAPPMNLDDLGASMLISDLVQAKADKADAEDRIEAAEVSIKELMGNHESAEGTVGNTLYNVKWPMRHFKDKPEKLTPAKPAYSTRQKTLTIKEVL
jgi:predicted phage-related endonuclease